MDECNVESDGSKLFTFDSNTCMRSTKVVIGVGTCSSANVTLESTDSVGLFSRAINLFSISCIAGRNFSFILPTCSSVMEDHVGFPDLGVFFHVLRYGKDLSSIWCTSSAATCMSCHRGFCCSACICWVRCVIVLFGTSLPPPPCMFFCTVARSSAKACIRQSNEVFF